MIGQVSAFLGPGGLFGAAITLIVVAAYVFIIALVIICLIRVSRYCMGADKERKLTRIELGKLAEEVRLIRQKLEDGKEQESSAESG